jgi:hypothetical protein
MTPEVSPKSASEDEAISLPKSTAVQMSVLWTLLRRAEAKKNSEALHLKLFLQSKLLRSMKGLEGPAAECIKEALRRSSEAFLDPYIEAASSPT